MRHSLAFTATAALMGALFVPAGMPPAHGAETGAFQTVGPLSEPRNLPAATLLLDARVLVTGGQDPNIAAVPSAELFDPTTDRFERLQTAMADARWLHTSTRLQDGRVLIVGGSRGRPTWQILGSAEIFDPVAQTFEKVGDMREPRSGHTATLLPDGRVLVVGGNNEVDEETGFVTDATASAEIFDPTTGQFTATGSMAGKRRAHGAVRLPDGRVALLGGIDDENRRPVRQVEIYDPATGSFSVRGELAVPRFVASVVPLMDGRVLIAGGINADDAVEASIETYDPAAGTSAIVGTLGKARFSAQDAVLADGRVLIAGGFTDFEGVVVESAELIDPATGSATPAASMSDTRAQGAAVTLQDGRVLVMGGMISQGASVLQSAEVYVP